jgi:hypothetical protein
MDWLQFIAAMTGNLAWPVVGMLLLLLIRNHLGSLADRLIELSFGGAKATFDKKLLEGAEILRNAPPVQLPPPDKLKETAKERGASRKLTRNGRTGRFMQIQSDDAVERVLQGLEEINGVLYDIGDTIGVDAASATSVMNHLVRLGIIGRDMGVLYDALASARNLVVHSHVPLGGMQAEEYARQVRFLLDALLALRDALDRTISEEDKKRPR